MSKNSKIIPKNTSEKISKNQVRFLLKSIEKNKRLINPSDSATRRRAAYDFLQALCIFFESQVIGIYSQYIDAMQKVNTHLSLDNY